MTLVETAIVATKSVTFVLGGLISFLSFKAYRRTGAPSLRALSLGFVVVTVGSLLGGALDIVTGVDLVYGVAAQSVLTMLGFGVITYSLYAR